MSEEAAFWEAIRNGDDTARLVFADWLEGRDDPRADLIKRSASLAKLVADGEATLSVQGQHPVIGLTHQQLRDYHTQWEREFNAARVGFAIDNEEGMGLGALLAQFNLTSVDTAHPPRLQRTYNDLELIEQNHPNLDFIKLGEKTYRKLPAEDAKEVVADILNKNNKHEVVKKTEGVTITVIPSSYYHRFAGYTADASIFFRYGTDSSRADRMAGSISELVRGFDENAKIRSWGMEGNVEFTISHAAYEKMRKELKPEKKLGD